jgi:hypothetical protein
MVETKSVRNNFTHVLPYIVLPGFEKLGFDKILNLS